MSANEITVLVLPGAATDPAELAATVGSVRGEVGEHGRIVACGGAAGLGVTAGSGVEIADPSAVAASPGLLAFARVGDRWRPGTWAARRRPLDAHPTAVLAVAGHVRTNGDGEGLPVPSPMPPVDPGSLLLRPCIEASSVIVRPGVLDGTAVELLHRPHGDALVWARLIAEHGHLPSGELAADVRFDPDRHGFSADASLDAMLADVATDDGDDEPAGRSAVRRELLRRLFLESADGLDVDLTTWIGPGAATPRVRAVLEDLSWALHRQREALAAERVAWRPETLGDGGPLEGSLDLENLRHQVQLGELYGEITGRDEIVRWLHTEIAQRDAAIQRLDGDLRHSHAAIEQLDAGVRDRHAAVERLEAELARRATPVRSDMGAEA